jgi:hypothetical protein
MDSIISFLETNKPHIQYRYEYVGALYSVSYISVIEAINEYKSTGKSEINNFIFENSGNSIKIYHLEELLSCVIISYSENNGVTCSM